MGLSGLAGSGRWSLLDRVRETAYAKSRATGYTAAELEQGTGVALPPKDGCFFEVADDMTLNGLAGYPTRTAADLQSDLDRDKGQLQEWARRFARD